MAAAPSIPAWADPEVDDRKPFGRGNVMAGLAVIGIFGLTFYLWAANAPVEGAVSAPGVVSVDSNVRTVQHLEGGIVSEILVRDGDRVEAGQVVMRLANTATSTNLNEVRAQYYEARATEARLTAEQDNADRIVFPDELTDRFGDQAARSAIAGQEKIFASRRQLQADRLTILERTEQGLQNQIAGLNDQIASSQERLALIRTELADVEKLFARSLVDKPRLLQLQREQAEVEGEIAGFGTSIAAARQQIEETNLRMSELRNTAATEAVEQLREARAQAYELGQRLAAAEEVMGRTEIRSPVAGEISGLAVHTVGGVIAAGQPLMDVVPVSDKLVIQATIDPMDIDQVSQGQDAQVWLSAVNRRSQTPIDAVVTVISPDRLIDPQTGLPFYRARIELDRAEVAKGALPLLPGMSAEVMIHTGARTMLDYLLAPVTDFLSRGLRESRWDSNGVNDWGVT